MKDESDDSGIIVYEIRDDYSAGSSPKSNKKTFTIEKKDASTPDEEQVKAESMAQLGGFSGRVYDKLTHRTIEGVLIAIAKDLSVKTDKKGIFSVVGIKPGKYHITAFEDGYVVHSCKTSAVAGETTKLESFNLIPDCLAAQYPEGMAQEEEETVEEEVVEFAMESPQVTPSGKLPEKTIKVSSDDVIVRVIPEETVPDLHTVKTINENKTVGDPETIIDEVTAHHYIDFPPKPSITELSLSPVDDTVAEAVQPEGIPEMFQEVASETTPQELIIEEIPFEAPIEESAQVEYRETVYEEQLFEPATEELSKQDVQLQGYQDQSLEAEPFAETVSETTPQEKPPIEPFLEEMQTPVIDLDSTEAVAFIPEEIIIDDLPSEQAQATIAEALGPEKPLEKIHEELTEKAPQGAFVKGSRLRQLWGMLRGKEQKETDQEQDSEPSTEESIEEALTLPAHREQLSLSSIETVPQVLFPEDVIEARLEEQPIEASLKEMQTPVIESESAEAAICVPEELIIKEESSIAEAPLGPVEITNVEVAYPEEVPCVSAIEEAPLENTMEGTALEKIKEATYQEPHLGTFAAESIEETLPLQEYQTLPIDPFMEFAPAIAHQGEFLMVAHEEEPPVEVSFEEIKSPKITEVLTDTVMAVPEEIIIEESLAVEELSSVSAETKGEAAAQSEEAPQQPSPEKRSQLLEKTVRHTKGKEQSTKPSTETMPQTTETSLFVPEEIIIKEEPSVEEAPITPIDIGAGKTARSEEVVRKPSAKQSRSKMLWLALRRKKPTAPYTEQSLPLPEHRVQPVKPSMEVSQQVIDQKDVLEESHKEEQPTNVSAENAIGHGVVDEDFVTPEETPEDIANYDIASLSDEERAAMSSEDDMAKAAGFEGSVNAQPNPAFKGLPVTIAYHLKNVACEDPSDFIIQIIVVNPDTGTIHETFESPITCAKNTFSIGGFTFSTSPYEAYIYTISMQIVSKMTKSAHFLDDIPLEIKNIF